MLLIDIPLAARGACTRALWLAFAFLSMLAPGFAIADTALASGPLVGELPARVRGALQHRGVPSESLSAYVLNVSTGDPVLAWNGDTPRNPASVMKLLTTLVALDVLGAAYTWRTDIYPLGNIEDGELDGDLLLKGYGDPFLVTERVWQMLRTLRRSGLKRIGGDLLLDDSYFRVEDYDPAAFDKQPLRAYNVGPNALLMNFKVVRYFFEPGDDGVRVQTDPQLDNLKIVNRLSLASQSCRGYQRGITIIPNAAFDEITFSGRFPDRCKTYSMARTALQHNDYTFGLFKSLWEDLGGSLGGGWRSIAVNPDEEPLLSFESWPLADVVSRVNKYSNNVMARHLLLTLGAESLGPPGTAAKGKRVIAEWLDARGLHDERFRLDNGSGLSRSSRITARQLAGLLSYAYQQPYMPEFLSSMSVSGLDGTTKRRFRIDDELAGRAHFKTGSLDNVSAIAGYLQAQSGDRYVVVALHNHEGIHRGPGEEVQDALMRWVYEL